MTSAATVSAASPLRVLVVDADRSHDVFEVVGPADVAAGVLRVRSPFLFEIGEQLALRLEQDGAVCEAVARVRAHVGPPEAPETELEITERSPARPMVSG